MSDTDIKVEKICAKKEKKNVGIEQDGCNITEARKFSSAEVKGEYPEIVGRV